MDQEAFAELLAVYQTGTSSMEDFEHAPDLDTSIDLLNHGRTGKSVPTNRGVLQLRSHVG